MSLIEARRKFSRRELIQFAGKSAAAIALSSCASFEKEEDTQSGTRGLRADPQPRTDSNPQIQRTSELNSPKEKSREIVAITSYASDFRKSEPYRIHNIIAGSNAINNHFWSFDGSKDSNGEWNKSGKNSIEPGESFSLGPVIVKGDYVKGFAQGPDLLPIEVDGGGICQISSTLNALALKSGLFIDVRKNHSYYNGWYFGEPNDPKEFGMDATIFIPGQDWVVTNTYAHPIRFLLKEKDQKLTAELYTSADASPLDVELDGPFMEWPNKGTHVKDMGRFVKACRTKLTQRVFIPGNGSMKALYFEDVFYSNYQASPYS